MSYLPLELAEILKKQFFFPEKQLFGAVATLAGKEPRIRTMRIYDLNPEGCPILLTHVDSSKWKEFVDHPSVSINMVSENRLVQIVVSGRLQLDTPQTASERARYYWGKVRPDVKKIYDPEHRVGELYRQIGVLNIPKAAPNTFGIASLIPSFWEVLLLESEYVNSQRYQFHLKGGVWEKRRVNVG